MARCPRVPGAVRDAPARRRPRSVKAASQRRAQRRRVQQVRARAHEVADFERILDELARLRVHDARTRGNDGALLGLLRGGARNEEPARRFILDLVQLDEHLRCVRGRPQPSETARAREEAASSESGAPVPHLVSQRRQRAVEDVVVKLLHRHRGRPSDERPVRPRRRLERQTQGGEREHRCEEARSWDEVMMRADDAPNSADVDPLVSVAESAEHPRAATQR